MQHASCIIASVHHVDIAKPVVNISQFPRQKTHCFSTAVNNQMLRPHTENMRQLISKCRDREDLILTCCRCSSGCRGSGGGGWRASSCKRFTPNKQPTYSPL